MSKMVPYKKTEEYKGCIYCNADKPSSSFVCGDCLKILWCDLSDNFLCHTCGLHAKLVHHALLFGSNCEECIREANAKLRPL